MRPATYGSDRLITCPLTELEAETTEGKSLPFRHQQSIIMQKGALQEPPGAYPKPDLVSGSVQTNRFADDSWMEKGVELAMGSAESA